MCRPILRSHVSRRDLFMGVLEGSRVLRHIRLLVCDLDYMVFDSAMLKAKALRQSLISFAEAIPQSAHLPDALDAEDAYREHGFRWVEFLELDLGDVAESLADSYRVQEGRLIESGAGQVYPGLIPVLDGYRQEGIQLALGADASRDYLMAVSDRHQLNDLFDLALCAEEFGRGSLDEMLEETMRLAEVNRSETLVLGTRPEYFRAAHELDLVCTGCGWGVQRREFLAQADYQALSPGEIVPVVLRADELAARNF